MPTRTGAVRRKPQGDYVTVEPPDDDEGHYMEVERADDEGDYMQVSRVKPKEMKYDHRPMVRKLALPIFNNNDTVHHFIVTDSEQDRGKRVIVFRPPDYPARPIARFLKYEQQSNGMLIGKFSGETIKGDNEGALLKQAFLTAYSDFYTDVSKMKFMNVTTINPVDYVGIDPVSGGSRKSKRSKKKNTSRKPSRKPSRKTTRKQSRKPSRKASKKSSRKASRKPTKKSKKKKPSRN